jgi:hypothetical protein
MNGRFTRGRRIDRALVVFSSSMDIPVTPPSIKLLGTKKSMKTHSRGNNSENDQERIA